MTTGRSSKPLLFCLLAAASFGCGGAAQSAAPAVDAGPVDKATNPTDTAPATDTPAAGTDTARPDATDAAARMDTNPAVEPCTPASTKVVCNTLLPLPPSIKDTGFFPAGADFKVLPPNARSFIPSLQLYSDGLHKERQMILPVGTKINNSDREVWDFPIGTVFLKTFLSDGPGGARRPIETRVIRRTDNPDIFEQWKYDVYKWNDAGTDATLLTLEERTPVTVTIGGAALTHQIPSRMDCEKCHQENDTIVIGFDEVRLNAPLVAGGKTQLETLTTAGVFTNVSPAPAAQVTDPDMLTARVKSYIYGNCVHCHNGKNPQVFSMRPEGFPASVINQMTVGSGTARGVRVVPGNPEMSILYRQLTRMNLTVGFNPMPPVGVQVADPEAVAMVRQWIMGLR